MFSVGLDELSFLFFFFNLIFYVQKRGITQLSEKSTLVSIENNNKITEILFGSLLGDGKLEMGPRAINPRFGFIQGEKNKEYFLFLFNEFSLLCSAKYREHTYFDIRTGAQRLL